MSTLIAASFSDKSQGTRLAAELIDMQKKRKIKVLDACVVWRHEDGAIEVRQMVESVEASIYYGVVLGGLAGVLIGFIFIDPVIGLGMGLLIGAVLGAIHGYLSDFGINNDFIQETGTLIKPETSAIFLLINTSSRRKVINHLSKYTGEILHTSYSRGKERDLFKQFQQSRKREGLNDIIDENRQLKGNI